MIFLVIKPNFSTYFHCC